MEEKNIVYTGITQATSDLDCPDGDLSISHNIINQNGTMKPIWIPDANFSMNDGERLLYIHTTTNYKNYIYLFGKDIRAFKFIGENRADYSFTYTIGVHEEVKQVQSVGNTVVLITNKTIQYLLFKDNVYIYLGDKAPELQMSFGLIGTRSISKRITVDLSKNTTQEPTGLPIAIDSYALSDEGATQATEQLIPEINKFINEQKTYGLFTEQFFVRYAYRTINGYYMQSAPVLMTPNSGRFPYLPASESPKYDGNVLKQVKTNITAYACRLNYRLEDIKVVEQFKKWADIIQSIDIFVTEPVTMYNQNGKVSMYKKPSDSFSFFKGADGGYMCVDSEKNIYAYTGELSQNDIFELGAPMIMEDDFNERLKSSSVFRKIKSLSINELKVEDVILVKEEVLSNLSVQDTLSDDYNSHDKKACEFSFVYNSRLNIANVKRFPFAFPAKCLVNYTNGEKLSDVFINKTYSYSLTVFIREAGSISKVVSEVSEFNNLGKWIYYPNTNAYRMIIERTDSAGQKKYADIQLTEHENLNGAYYYSNDGVPFSNNIPAIPTDTVDYIREPNKIYTSEVDNPFYFPLGGINTVGVGKIVGISSTTQALSQGQFGQFPLLVFATDGIWAMEVSSTGLYSTKQPISRDVCSNPSSITQIDNAVVFVSDKGVMIVSGNEVSSISSELDGSSFDKNGIIMLDRLLEKEGLTNEVGDKTPVKQFFSGCKIAYDYPNSRLILFRDDKSYAFVYSLYSRSWATMSSDFKFAVSDYPNTYIQKGDNGVINISEKIDFDSQDEVTTLMLSRPMKMGDDVYKAVNTVINRGAMRRNKGALVVFASLDGLEYFPIGSATGNRVSRLQGSPYRYFRLAIIGKMTIRETLSMSSIYYTPKWRNKPR